MRWPYRIRLFVVACLVAFPAASAPAQSLTIRFLDVGQGDAALVVTPEGRKALIDAGPSVAGVASYVRAAGHDTLDLVVASHNHADHIGGMAEVLRSTVVRFYLDNGLPHTTATYQRTIRAVEASGAQYLEATPRTVTLGSAQLQVLPMPRSSRSQNNRSVGILLTFGEFSALFTGDSEGPQLAFWLGAGSAPPVDVVKVAHHGSGNGTTRAWVQATRARAAVISVGANSYGHPSPFVERMWAAGGASVYRTDRHGTIEITATRDGEFTVTTHAGAGVLEPGGRAARPPPALDAIPPAAPADSVRACCRVCRTGKACGNTCISRRYRCHQPPGCACDAIP